MRKLTFCLFALLQFSTWSNLGQSLGHANAPQGGIWKYNLGQQPTTLNALSSTDYYASVIQAHVLESLAVRNLETYEWEPSLATSWTVAKDGLSYTFKIRQGIKWHDGQPFTAQDIKFTFDAIMDPKNTYKTAHLRPSLENIDKCKIIDPQTVQFVAKRKYFANFDVVASMGIVPRHLYQNPDKKTLRKLNKTLVGTGPYRLQAWKRGKYIKLAANKNWWGKKEPKRKDEYNYAQILVKFIRDGNSAIQYLQKGDLDFQSFSPEEFMEKTNGPMWGKKIFKVKYENKAGKGYGFIGWNLKNDILSDRKVRLALYHLIDRKKMIEKFDFGLNLPATGPWYQQSLYADPKVKPIPYDPSKALALLKEAGWQDSNKNGTLDKVIKGKRREFRLTILEPNKEFRKYLVVFQQDAKKAGVDIQIKLVEWNTFVKLLHERKFEAVRLAWSGGVIDIDPKTIWHSHSYKNQGYNFVGYSNQRVDELIDKSRQELDRNKRVVLLREVYRLIAQDVPYAFLFNGKYGFYGHSKRSKRKQDTYKFGRGLSYWWIGQ